MTKTEKAIEALEEVKRFIKLTNDFDAYLYEVVNWGLGIRATAPDPDDY